MTRVIGDISMSLDGLVTGPDARVGNGMGDGGMALHAWAFSDDPAESRLLKEAAERSGVVVMGRRLFDIVDAPGGWSEEVGYGVREVAKPPMFVVTSSVPADVRLKGLDWTFVTTGLADAVARAKARAQSTDDKRDVVLMGGGTLVGSALAAGLLDALMLHIAPVVLGSGTRLFPPDVPLALVQRTVIVTPSATHITYEPA